MHVCVMYVCVRVRDAYLLSKLLGSFTHERLGRPGRIHLYVLECVRDV